MLLAPSLSPAHKWTSLNLAHGEHPQASSKTQQSGTDAGLPYDPALWVDPQQLTTSVARQSDSDMEQHLFGFLMKGHRANM